MALPQPPKEAPLILHLLVTATSSTVVQAGLVGLFGVAVVIMALQGREIPDIVTFSLASIIGYYFGDTSGRFPPPVTPQVVPLSRRVLDQFDDDDDEITRRVPVPFPPRHDAAKADPTQTQPVPPLDSGGPADNAGGANDV